MKKLPKTLYVILTHNEKHLSTQYYEALKYYQEQDNFDLIFLDTGVVVNIDLIKQHIGFQRMYTSTGRLLGLGKRCWKMMSMSILFSLTMMFRFMVIVL